MNINDPLASIIARCIRNSPDTEIKRREVQKLKDMFRSNPEKQVWDIANRITFDRCRDRKVYLEKSSKMLDCDTKNLERELRRELAKIDGWDFA